MSEQKLKTLLEIKCVCGGRVVAVETADAERHPGVMHEQPMCHEFESREPDMFLTWLRQYYERGQN